MANSMALAEPASGSWRRSQEPVAPRWQRVVLDWIPWSVRRWFDPHHYPRYEFVRAAAMYVRDGDIVLDAGAGESPFKPLFAHARYIGLDNRCGDPAWDYSKLDVVSDLMQLGVRPQSVDHVLCNDVLEHVADPAALVVRLGEVLKPGGTLFLSAPQGWGQHQNPHDYFRFTSHALRMLFERAGLEVESIRPLGGFFYYLANRIQMLPIMLFPPAPRWAEWLTMPLKLVAVAVFGIAIPAILMRLDWLDREKHTTLTYACWCRKPFPAD